MLDDDDELETIKSLAIGTLILVVFMMVFRSGGCGTYLPRFLKVSWIITTNIRESKYRKRRPSFNLRLKLTKDENCEMLIFRFYYKIIFRPSELT